MEYEDQVIFHATALAETGQVDIDRADWPYGRELRQILLDVAIEARMSDISVHSCQNHGDRDVLHLIEMTRTRRLMLWLYRKQRWWLN